MVGNWNRAGQNGCSRTLLRPGEADGLFEALLDAVLAEQRSDWIAGKRIPAHETLRQHPDLANVPAYAAELIYHEFSLRHELGELPDWRQHTREYPEHAALLERLRQADQLVEQTLALPAQLPTGTFADYDLLEEAGRGGMGVVFKARHKNLDRIVALKVLRSDGTDEERNRFDREARAVARLQHPNIVQVYEVGGIGRAAFVALEYVDGESLAHRLNGTPLPARCAAALVGVLAGAMHYAHERGVIHRDLKPANVLLAGLPETPIEGCIAKVADFGLAKKLDAQGDTHSGTVLGTPSYMAPEQAEARSAVVDRRTDVYGLGAILYELLTGRPPFRADSAVQTLRQVLDAEPVRPRLLNPSVSRDLETICLKCLAKEPSRRYPTALELAADLERFENGRPVLARPVGTLARGWRWCRRNPIPAGLTALLALVLIGGLSGILYQWHQAVAARREAVTQGAQARLVLSELIQSSPVRPFIDYYPQPPSIEPLVKAAQRCRELLENNPEDVELRIALTNVYGRLGWRYAQSGEAAEQAAAIARAAQLWETPLRQVAVHPDYQYWLGKTRYWLGNLALDQEEIAQGYQWILSADEIWEHLAEDQPENLDVLANATQCRNDLRRITAMSSLAEICRPFLETLKTQLEQQFQQSSSAPHGLPGRVLRKRLALICQALGNARDQMNAPDLARQCRQQAADIYAALDANGQQPATTEDALHLALAGDVYSRLAGRSPSDAYYARSVAAFERARKRLERLGERIFDSESLSATLPNVYCSLARCHIKAGRPDLAEKTFQDHLRPLLDCLEAQRNDPQHAMAAESIMCELVHSLCIAELRPAALAVARRAAELTTAYVAFPLHYPEVDFPMAAHAWDLARGLRDLGDPAASLQQAEHARNLWADYWRARPNALTGGMQLAQAWVEVGKSRQALGRTDDAWTAFQQAVSVQCRVLDRAPHVQFHRVVMGWCYNQLVDCGIRRGDWSGAAAALHEREKLWPDDFDRLMRLSVDFMNLAEEMARASKRLSGEEQKARQQYLAESERTRQAAEAAARHKKHGLRVTEGGT